MLTRKQHIEFVNLRVLLYTNRKALQIADQAASDQIHWNYKDENHLSGFNRGWRKHRWYLLFLN